MGETEACDIAVIGAGAAGLAAGIFAGEAARARGAKLHIALLDGAKTIGAKILVSGGGRCNVTHDAIDSARDFHGSKNIVRNVLAAFDEQKTVKWFESMGVRLKREETGKLFPVSDDARTVLDALLRRIQELGVELREGTCVTALARDQEGFVIGHRRGAMRAKRVIVATGGRSLPKTGSDGAFYDVMQRLGHTVTKTWPALVPLVLEEGFFHAELSGLSQEVELTTAVDGKVVDRRKGSLLWTHFGVSGPVVMDASRFWIMGAGNGAAAELKCSILPEWNFETLEKVLIDSGKKAVSVGKVIGQWLPARVANAVLRYCTVEPSTPMAQLSKEARQRVVQALTALKLPVAKDRGWNYAEVTAGGVPLNEIDFRTMESRKVKGMFLAGEILDCDGRIGGFNFQWAWATGFLAGSAAAEC